MKNNYVITGSSSGIGKYLKEKLNGSSYNRLDNNQDHFKKNNEQIIMHAAFNMNNKIYYEDLDRYIQDTIKLTKKIITLPNKKFIFFSTIDVYPLTPIKNIEANRINLFDTNNLYALTKLICENLILKHCNNAIILRLSYMVGKYMRNNNVKKAILGGKQDITISGNSTFNIVTYKEIFTILERLLNTDQSGIFNIASNHEIKLKDICEYYQTKANFGTYKYNSPSVSINKIKNLDLHVYQSKECIIKSLKTHI